MDILEEIDAEFERNNPIPFEKVKGWMQSDDLEILGAVADLLESGKTLPRITPKPSIEQLNKFLMAYWIRCMNENSGMEYDIRCVNEGSYGRSESAFEAGTSITNWFKILWEKDRNEPTIKTIKNTLESLYKNGNEDIKNLLILSTLEHLFDNPKIADYFADWTKDPELEKAFKEAVVVYEVSYSKYYPPGLGYFHGTKSKKRR